MAFIEVRGLRKTFGRGKGAQEVLRGVDLSVEEGEVFGVVGLSGAGKSTLIRCLNRLEEPSAGSIVIGGVDMLALSEGELRLERRRMGMIFQSFNLLSSRTALGNVAFPLEAAGVGRKEIRARAAELLELVGLSGKADSYPAQLSGGQKQRVSIARALAMDPKLMLLDEPTSALDPELIGEVLNVIQNLYQGGMTMLMVTHQVGFASHLTDEVLFMEGVRITERGAPRALLDPDSGSRAAAFCGKFSEVTGL